MSTATKLTYEKTASEGYGRGIHSYWQCALDEHPAVISTVLISAQKKFTHNGLNTQARIACEMRS